MSNQQKYLPIRLPNGSIVKVNPKVYDIVKSTSMPIQLICPLCNKNYVGKNEVYCNKCRNEIKNPKQISIEKPASVPTGWEVSNTTNHIYIRDDCDKRIQEDPLHMFKFSKRDFDSPVFFVLGASFMITLITFICHLVTVRHYGFDNFDLGFILTLIAIMVLGIYCKFWKP